LTWSPRRKMSFSAVAARRACAGMLSGMGRCFSPRGARLLRFASSSPLQVHPGHIQLTRHLPRGSELVSATVERVDLVTPTVTTLQLSLSEESELRFAPGQWVDMYIPGVDVIGGFSLVSTPFELPSLKLAVRHSSHPPARWCCAQAKAGDQVQIRVGGDFGLDDRLLQDFMDGRAHLLLLAGGIGINPLLSIYSTLGVSLNERLAEQGSDRKEELGDAAGTCHLLYSAREPEEFAFRAEIEEGAAAWPKNLSVSFRATHVGQEGRLEAEDVEKAVDALRGRDGSVIAFVCGPPAFTDTMEGYALMAGADDVRLERWW